MPHGHRAQRFAPVKLLSWEAKDGGQRAEDQGASRRWEAGRPGGWEAKDGGQKTEDKEKPFLALFPADYWLLSPGFCFPGYLTSALRSAAGKIQGTLHTFCTSGPGCRGFEFQLFLPSLPAGKRFFTEKIFFRSMRTPFGNISDRSSTRCSGSIRIGRTVPSFTYFL